MSSVIHRWHRLRLVSLGAVLPLIILPWVLIPGKATGTRDAWTPTSSMTTHSPRPPLPVAAFDRDLWSSPPPRSAAAPMPAPLPPPPLTLVSIVTCAGEREAIVHDRRADRLHTLIARASYGSYTVHTIGAASLIMTHADQTWQIDLRQAPVS